MRTISLSIVVLLFSVSALRANDGIAWHRDLDSAKRAAAHLNRPILLHFWSPSCVPCVKLEQDVYSRPEVKRALESMFVLARLNADDYPATASTFGVKSWPADVILSPQGEFQALLKCPAAPQQYVAQLEQVGRSMNGRALQTQALASAPAAAGMLPNNAVAPTSIVQTSGQTPAAGQPAATGGTSPYAWSGSGGQVETYNWSGASQAPTAGQAATMANTSLNGAQVQAPATQQAQPPQPQTNPFVGQQTVANNTQQPPAQQFEMVAAVAAPPIGLDGYCPVQLARPLDKRQAKWVKGDPRYGVVHRGRTYLFSGPAEQQEFLRDPDRYSPVMGGIDPVLLFDQGWQVAGDRRFGRFFGDRVYLFSAEESLNKFLAENEASRQASRPNRYAEAIYQAENPSGRMLR